MAIRLFKPGSRKGNIHWIARGRIDGQQIEAVCRDESGQKTTDRASARRFASALERRILAEGRHAREIPKTLSDVAEKYKAARSPRKADEAFIDKLCGHLGDKPIRRLQQTDFDEAANLLYPGGSNETKNRQIYTVASYLMHYAARNKWCPWVKIDRLKEKQPETRRVGDEDRDKMLVAAAEKDPEVLSLLRFLFLQGWRISEALALRWEPPKRGHRHPYIDLPGKLFHIWVNKAQKWKQVPMHPAIFEDLANRDTKAGAVFPVGPYYTARRRLITVCKAAGVSFTFHRARHTFADRLHKEAGADAKSIKNAGSWTNEKSVMRYVADDVEHARGLIGSLTIDGTGEAEEAGGERGEGERPMEEVSNG